MKTKRWIKEIKLTVFDLSSIDLSRISVQVFNISAFGHTDSEGATELPEAPDAIINQKGNTKTQYNIFSDSDTTPEQSSAKGNTLICSLQPLPCEYVKICLLAHCQARNDEQNVCVI